MRLGQRKSELCQCIVRFDELAIENFDFPSCVRHPRQSIALTGIRRPFPGFAETPVNRRVEGIVMILAVAEFVRIQSHAPRGTLTSSVTTPGILCRFAYVSTLTTKPASVTFDIYPRRISR